MRYIPPVVAGSTKNQEDLDSQRRPYKEKVEPLFFTYMNGIDAICDSKVFSATFRVLCKMLSFAEINSGIIYMTQSRKRELMNKCKVSKASYYRALQDLKDANVFVGTGDTIIINSNMFWRGTLQEREKHRKMYNQLKIGES